MHTLYPCLWFDGKAEEAAQFYTSRSRTATSTGLAIAGRHAERPAGMVLTVDFTLAGQRARNERRG